MDISLNWERNAFLGGITNTYELAEFQFNELEPVAEGMLFFDGLPDTGLVGTIVAHHLVGAKKMSPLVRIDSNLLPPVAVVKDMDLFEPLSVYRSGTLAVLTSEIPIPTEAVKPFSRELTSWAARRKLRAIISVGGLADPRRPETDKPEVLYITNSPETFSSQVDLKGLKPLASAFLAGSKAAFLLDCYRAKLPTLGLFVQSFLNYPDPGAAASALDALNNVSELNVDTSELVKSGEEMRLRYRDLMRRTMGEMERAQKSRELETPSLVV